MFMKYDILKSVVNQDVNHIIRDIQIQIQVVDTLLQHPRSLDEVKEEWYVQGLNRQRETLERLLEDSKRRLEYINEYFEMHKEECRN